LRAAAVVQVLGQLAETVAGSLHQPVGQMAATLVVLLARNQQGAH
jgi:hypothetical protein